MIGALLVFSAGLGFSQERRGRQAVALLRSQLSAVARVRRDGRWQLVPTTEVVADDAVHVRAGDLVPADVRLSDGMVSLHQSQLTGESLPVEAGPGEEAFAGWRVARGEASGLVTAAAAQTRFGKTAQLVQLARTPQRMERFIVAAAKYLSALDALLIAVVMAAAVIPGHLLESTLLFALRLLVESQPSASMASKERRGPADASLPAALA